MIRSTPSVGPPTKITSDPDSASALLPRTGASSSLVPGGSEEASQVTAVGPTVDMSTTVSGGRAPAAIPCGPCVTERSACGSLSMVISTSARLAASAGVAASAAPRPDFPGGSVPDSDLVAGVQQPGRNTAPHGAQPYHRDRAHRPPPVPGEEVSGSSPLEVIRAASGGRRDSRRRF